MASYNKITIVGNLGRDPEMRYTATGKPVTNFSVAVSKKRKNEHGELLETTTWFRCVAWERTAEVCNEYLTKGSQVLVEGEMVQRDYTDREGNKREAWEVQVREMVMLGSKGDRQAQEAQEAPAAPPPARAAAPRPERVPAQPARPAARNAPQPVDDYEEIPF